MTAPRPISISAITNASPDVQATKADNITTRRIYQDIITKERRGVLWREKLVVPHVTNAIKEFVLSGNENGPEISCWSRSAAPSATSSMRFFEAIRQLKKRRIARSTFI